MSVGRRVRHSLPSFTPKRGCLSITDLPHGEDPSPLRTSYATTAERSCRTTACGLSPPLAGGADVGAAATHDEPPDGGAADQARLAGPPVDGQRPVEVAGVAVHVHVERVE